MNPNRRTPRRPALDEREAPTMEHSALPDLDEDEPGATKYVTNILPKANTEDASATQSGSFRAYNDDDEREERRERRETIPAPPDDGFVSTPPPSAAAQNRDTLPPDSSDES